MSSLAPDRSVSPCAGTPGPEFSLRALEPTLSRQHLLSSSRHRPTALCAEQGHCPSSRATNHVSLPPTPGPSAVPIPLTPHLAQGHLLPAAPLCGPACPPPPSPAQAAVPQSPLVFLLVHGNLVQLGVAGSLASRHLLLVAKTPGSSCPLFQFRSAVAAAWSGWDCLLQTQRSCMRGDSSFPWCAGQGRDQRRARRTQARTRSPGTSKPVLLTGVDSSRA